MEYSPDGFSVIKFTPEGEDVYYKVFGSWTGGYLYGDYWRLSSGSTPDKIKIDGDKIEWPQSSGSVYYLNKHSENRLSSHNYGILSSLLTQINKLCPAESVTLDELIVTTE